MPAIVPIGTDNQSALGRITEGLCTSSAILVTIASTQMDDERHDLICAYSYRLQRTHRLGNREDE